MLQKKKILIGITGSIAAYKIILLVRLLVKEGAEVRVILTENAKDFVSPLVLSTLSKNKVFNALIQDGEWINHVDLGRWADVFLIAPLSCNSLAKIATGICDNLLLATYFSATCTVVVAPAMDVDMWQHPATQRNLATIQNDGVKVIQVEKGELASGLFGEGRMAEPEHLLNYLKETFFLGKKFSGKKILVTAGPTYEPIDPVRFIGNYSSGKMGFAIANIFYEQGGDVTLVTGPTHERLAYSGIKRIDIKTAEEMFDSCKQNSNADIIVMSAAVADFRPLNTENTKIKKSNGLQQIELTPNPDILDYLGHHRTGNQFIAGFALETNDEEKHALEKLEKKNIDCIIMNSLRDSGAGFGVDTNTVTIFDKDGELHLDNAPKKEIAEGIVRYVAEKVMG